MVHRPVAMLALGCVSCGELLGVSDYAVADEPPGPAGTPAAACGPLMAPAPSGECERVGVPERGCEDFPGFEDDGEGGCAYSYNDICPSDPRLLASPGNNCIAGCNGPPLSTGVYVDGAAEDAGDGTPEHPFRRIADAIPSAGPGRPIYVLGDSPGPTVYEENVDLPQGVSLFGWPCFLSVEIKGIDTSKPTMTFRPDHYTGLSGVSITGGSLGVLVQALALADGDGGVSQPSAWISEIRVHGVTGPGIVIENASVELDRVLVQDVESIGVLVTATDAAAEPVVTFSKGRVEDVQPASAPGPYRVGNGWCLASLANPLSASPWASMPAAVQPRLEIEGALIQGCAERGVYATWGDLSIAGSVIRRIALEAIGSLGQGLGAEFGVGARPDRTVTVKNTLIDQVAGVGVSVRNIGSASIERSTIKSVDGQAVAGTDCREGGIGVLAAADATSDEDAGYRFPSTLRVAESAVRGARIGGIQIAGVTGSVDHTLVADTRADARGCPLAYGDGIVVYGSPVPTDATVTISRVEGSERAAVASFGPDARVQVNSVAVECCPLELVSGLHAPPIAVPSPGSAVCACNGDGRRCVAVQDDHLQPSLVGIP